MRHLMLALSLTVFSPIAMTADVMQFPKDLSQSDKPATIKILITDKKEKLLLEAKGSYQVYDPISNLELDKGVMPKRGYLTYSPEGLSWNGCFPGVFQIRVTPADAKSSLLIDGIEYRGCVEIYAMQGKLHVINEVDIERYLKATLTAELLNETDRDVLEAVAILARTNAYNTVSKTPHAYWHVKAHDVGYVGYGLSLQNIPVETAVNTTRYLVLTHNHEPFEACWTKNSAGKTADFSAIFRKESPVCKSVDTPLAKKDREKSAWSFALSYAELSKLLQMEAVTSIDLYQDPKTQRVYAVRIKDKRGTHDLDFFTFQNKLGEQRLRSNDFTTRANPQQIAFQGYGEGHGVGLCLHSAAVMAEHGDNAPKILGKFFPETQLETLKTVRAHAH